jgi:hypothetical protein
VRALSGASDDRLADRRRGLTPLDQHRRVRTVVTSDALGVSRSERTDDAKESTPAEHADVLGGAADRMDRQRDLWERLVVVVDLVPEGG